MLGRISWKTKKTSHWIGHIISKPNFEYEISRNLRKNRYEESSKCVRNKVDLWIVFVVVSPSSKCICVCVASIWLRHQKKWHKVGQICAASAISFPWIIIKADFLFDAWNEGKFRANKTGARVFLLFLCDIHCNFVVKKEKNWLYLEGREWRDKF